MRKRVFNNHTICHLVQQSVFIVTVIVALIAINPHSESYANSTREELSVIEKWSGNIAYDDLLSKAPNSKTVTDQAAWIALWRAWRPGAPAPVVDFSKHIVLVETAKGPNNILTSTLNLTPSGDLRYEAIATKKNGTGFGYAMMAIPRKGIISINGKLLSTTPTLPPKTSPPKNAEPAHMPTQSEIDKAIAQAKPTIAPRNKLAQTPPAPTQASTLLPNARIDVDIFGTVMTGELVGENGRKTKSAMVVANGIVWSLDFGANPSLFLAAQKLRSNLARVTGTLTKQTESNRSGEKLVVIVQSITSWDGQSQTPQANSNPLANNNPIQPNANLPLATQRNPIQPNQPNPLAPMNANPAPATTRQTPAQRNGFRSIMVSITGGKSPAERRQTVMANGNVRIEVPATKHLETFNLDPSTLDQLHQFVVQTDWKSIPAASRTGGVDRNATGISVSVETAGGTKRFFMDGPAAAADPVVRNLFMLMRRPK